MKLSVIIVNYNVKYFLEQCLCSVIQAIKNVESEIFVVDNNSQDGSQNFLQLKFNTVKFIWNKKNIGFAKANNMALLQASGDYILFLNPDTIVPEDCFEKCISFLNEHSTVGTLGVYMMDGEGKFLKESKRSFPSPMTSLYKLFGFSSIFPKSKIFAKYHLGDLDENKNHEVDVLAGAFMMVPKKVIAKAGSFDEDFFMYGEDIDLSYRIQQAGYKNFYCSEVSIIHFKGESTKKGSLNYVKMFYNAMSIFVKKHYGGGKAGIYIFLIQVAIFLRAVVSAISRFIRWIGLPVIDAAIILMSFWLVKFIWNHYVKQQVNYSSNLLLIAFPVFTLIYLATSYFSGLYDNGYRQARLNRSAAIATLVILAIYSLLPESLRFSRGILLFGSILAFLLITLIRWLMMHWHIIESGEEDEENRQTIIIGTEKEFDKVRVLMNEADRQKRILGRLDVNGVEAENSIGHINHLSEIIKTYPVKEVVLCEGKLSFKNIIDIVKKMPPGIRIKIHSLASESIVGSDSKDMSGKYLTHNMNFKLSDLICKRNKRLIDIIISFVFIITFPVHFVFQKKSFYFFINVFAVIFGRKTWVGYASNLKDLPALKKGILTTTGVPAHINNLPEKSLISADRWYAKHYNLWNDVQLIWSGYKYLSS